MKNIDLKAIVWLMAIVMVTIAIVWLMVSALTPYHDKAIIDTFLYFGAPIEWFF